MTIRTVLTALVLAVTAALGGTATAVAVGDPLPAKPDFHEELGGLNGALHSLF
jgi:hypothetical protein